jgi:hypothetical protein
MGSDGGLLAAQINMAKDIAAVAIKVAWGTVSEGMC